jgi:hypothetical protein
MYYRNMLILITNKCMSPHRGHSVLYPTKRMAQIEYFLKNRVSHSWKSWIPESRPWSSLKDLQECWPKPQRTRRILELLSDRLLLKGFLFKAWLVQIWLDWHAYQLPVCLCKPFILSQLGAQRFCLFSTMQLETFYFSKSLEGNVTLASGDYVNLYTSS